LVALSQHLPCTPAALGEVDGVEVWAAAIPTPASIAAAAINPILVIAPPFILGLGDGSVSRRHPGNGRRFDPFPKENPVLRGEGSSGL